MKTKRKILKRIVAFIVCFVISLSGILGVDFKKTYAVSELSWTIGGIEVLRYQISDYGVLTLKANSNSSQINSLNLSGLSESDALAKIPWSEDAGKITSVKFSDSSYWDKVTDISYWFYGTNITECSTLPTNVKKMRCTFKNCTKLKKVSYLPDTCMVMQSSFTGCTNLEYVTAAWPSELTNMAWVFSGCEKLLYVYPKIPASVSSMKYAFTSCKNLTTVLHFEDSNSLTKSGIDSMLKDAATEEKSCVYFSGAAGTSGLKLNDIISNSGYTSNNIKTNTPLTLLSMRVTSSSLVSTSALTQGSTLAKDNNNNVYSFGETLDMVKTNGEVSSGLNNMGTAKSLVINKGVRGIGVLWPNFKTSSITIHPDFVNGESTSIQTPTSISNFNKIASGLTVVCTKKQFEVFSSTGNCSDVTYIYPKTLEINNFSQLDNYEGHNFNSSIISNSTISLKYNNGNTYTTLTKKSETSDSKDGWIYSVNDGKGNSGTLEVTGNKVFSAGDNVYSFTLKIEGTEYKGTAFLNVKENIYTGVEVASTYNPKDGDIFDLDKYKAGIDRITFKLADGTSLSPGRDSVEIKRTDSKDIVLTAGNCYVNMEFTYNNRSYTKSVVIYVNSKKAETYEVIEKKSVNVPVAVVGKDNIKDYLAAYYELKVYYDNGTESTMSIISNYIVSQNTKFTTVGTETVQISVNGYTCYATVATRAALITQIVSAVYKGEAKYKGQSISMKDIEVVLKDEGGNTKTYKGDATDIPGTTTSKPYRFSIDTADYSGNGYINAKLQNVGPNKLTLRITNLDSVGYCEFNVDAMYIQAEKMTATCKYATLTEGLKPSKEDITVTLYLSNGDTVQTEEFEIDENYVAVAGENAEVMVTYTGSEYKNIENPYSICDTVSIVGIPKEVLDISVTYKGNLVEGTVLKSEDFDVSVTYNNNTSEKLTDFTLSETKLVVGQNPVKISFIDNNGDEKEKTIYLTGNRKKLSSVQAEYNGTVIENCKLNEDLLSITLLYDNGTEEKGDVKNCTISDYVIKAGIDNEINLSYEGFNTTFTVKGIENIITNVEFITPEITYTEGTKLRNIKVQTVCTYLDGTRKEGVSVNSADKGFVKEGENTVNVEYLGFKSTVKVKGCSNNLKINSDISINIGKSKTLTIMGDNKELTKGLSSEWKSSDSKVATVTNNGTIKGISVGTATITATVLGHKLSCKVTVLSPCTSLDFKTSSLTLLKGSKNVLSLTRNPIDTTSTIIWISSNNRVATVNQNGQVKALSAGTCYIIASSDNGKSAKCKIKVVTLPSKIKLNKKSCTLGVRKSISLKYTLPAGSVSPKITWTSSNKKVARVDKTGKVTALKKGKAVITVTTSNKKKATCVITVK